MQTFLTDPCYSICARVLDNRRLGKQRVEAKQILMALACGPYQEWYRTEWIPCATPLQTKCLTRKTPWYNHPAVQMWKGYERGLAQYGLCCVYEWESRGFKDTTRDYFLSWIPIFIYPPWFIPDGPLIISHRSNLLRKNKEYYQHFWPNTPDNLPYYWPTKEKQL